MGAFGVLWMRLLTIYTSRFLRSSAVTAFCAVLFLLCFGAESGLASQQVYVAKLRYLVLSGGSYPTAANPPFYSFFYIGDKPNVYEMWPFLASMQHQYSSANSLDQWYDYGYSLYGSPRPPVIYQYFQGTISRAGTIPDDWTSADIAEINQSYQALSDSQKLACTGSIVAGNKSVGDVTEKFFMFTRGSVGSVANGNGVYTYDNEGNVVVSYPDNTGYASGYKVQPDGSFTPTYYSIEDGQVTEVSDITPAVYDTLTFDSESGNYSLNVPNYNKQLDKIINKLDTIKLDNIELTVPTPEVNVTVPTPEVTVNVPAPGVTVNVPAPEVSVTIPDSISSSLDDISGSLSNIESAVNAEETVSPAEEFSDLTLTSDEQALVDRYSDWETNIPLIGRGLDFGLNTLLGRLPSIGTEYVWLDYTIGGSSSSASSSGRRSSSLASSSSTGYHIRVDLTSYQSVLLATRGVLILGEALYFIILVYRAIRQALTV